MRIFSLMLLAALVTVSHPAPARAASFDCNMATTWIETTICGDTELSELDRLLGLYYESARYMLETQYEAARYQPDPQALACFREDQRRWLADRNRCRSAACIRTTYLARLYELEPLQPGANLRNDLDYPGGPRLAWILPPAPEIDPENFTELARRDSESAEIEGLLIAGEGGRLLKGADGTLHILVANIVLSTRGRVKLDRLTQGDADVIVRGPHGTTANGDPAFDPHACRFIHQIF